MRTIYISGPMRGYAEFNFPAFSKAAKSLRDKGFDVISPAESFGGRTDLAAEDYLRKDVGDLLTVDAVVVLPGWQNSVGVMVELTVAAALRIPVYELDSFLHFSDGAVPEFEPAPLNLDYLLVGIGNRAGEPTKKAEQETALQTANRLVYGNRQKDYGHPYDDFSKTAAFWSTLFGVEVRPEQVALAMIFLKASRLMNSPDHYDSIVDIAGYAGTYELTIEKVRELRESA